jgi:hypothetical protein
MNDFEDRLSTALRSAGDDAPNAAGLAPAARSRASARSRRTALAGVAAAVAVAGLVVTVAVLTGDDDGATSPPLAADPTSTESTSPNAPVDDTRVESWRDVSVVVPADWGAGYLDDWCGSGGELGSSVVERPGGASIDILCDPASGYGVRFLDGAAINLAYPPGHIWQYEKGDVEEYPDGSWLGYEQGSGDNLVWVVAKDRATVAQVLGSFRSNEDVDPNGCAARGGDGASVEAGSLRLCRYDMDGWLEQSELLGGADAAEAVEALEAAPARDPERVCTMEISGPTVQLTSADAEGSLTLNACQGFTWDDVAHELTADVIYWALSPGWSGGVEGDVPMPEKLRQ